MPISLAFTLNRDIMKFFVIDKNIFYSDKKFKTFIRCIPKPENFLNQIKMSRNKLPQALIQMFNLTEEEIKQYKSANSEEELAQIIIKDAKGKGCRLLLKTELTKDQLEDIKFID